MRPKARRGSYRGEAVSSTAAVWSQTMLSRARSFKANADMGFPTFPRILPVYHGQFKKQEGKPLRFL